MEDKGRLCQLLIRRSTPAEGGDLPVTSAAPNERWNGGSWHRRTSPSGFRLELHDDEKPEVLDLRRLIVEQNATLNERRRRIEATEKQIEEYERRIHDDRCLYDGYDYVQRAYDLPPNDLSDDDDDLVIRCSRVATKETIAACYREASNEIRQQLTEVEVQLIDIANACRRIASAGCDDDKHSGQAADEFDGSAFGDVKRKTADNSLSRRRRASRLEELRLELGRADDIRLQQLAEHHRLSTDVERAQSQLNNEEARLFAMLTGCDGSPYVPPSSSSHHISSDIQKLPQPLTAKSKDFTTAECQRHLEQDGEIARRSDPDGETTASAGSPSTSSRSSVIQLDGSRNRTSDCKYAASKSCEISTNHDIFVASKDFGCGSLPGESDPFFERHRLTTLV